MSIVVMQVFVSLLLVAGSLVLFLHSVRARDFDHADRLALAPLEDDGGQPTAGAQQDLSTKTTTAITPETGTPCTHNASNTTTR